MEIQVPGTGAPADEPTDETDSAVGPSDAEQTEEMTTDELIAEIERLKHQQALDAERNRRISAELELIQAALDRLVELLGPSPSLRDDQG